MGFLVPRRFDARSLLGANQRFLGWHRQASHDVCHAPRAAGRQRGGGCLGSVLANLGKESLPRVCWSRARVLQTGHRRRRDGVLLGFTPFWWQRPRGCSSRRLHCCSTWPSSTSMSATTTCGRRASKRASPRRLPAGWCASYEGWRFLEADKCATFPFWAFGTILPGCSGATTAAKLVLATLLETVSSRLPSYRLWNVVDDISEHVAGSPRMVQAITAEAAKLFVEGLQARDLPLTKGKSKVLIDGPDTLKQGLLQHLEQQAVWQRQPAAPGASGSSVRLGHTLAT